MGTTLELVFKYRQLAGRCDAGVGIDIDGIHAMLTIESFFAPADPKSDELAAERVHLEATVRNPSLNDRVTVVSLGPTGCACRQAPYAEEGDTLELVIEDAACGLSYRFKARVAQLRDDVDDDFYLLLEFIGVPLLVRYGSPDGAGVAQLAA